MGFKLSSEARKYFQTIKRYTNTGEIDFWDFYYYCALVGMKKQKISGEQEQLIEFMRGYDQDYLPSRYLIAGLLVDAELKRTCEPLTRENVHAKFSRYLDTSNEVLNNLGQDMLNRYAQGGFEYLRDNESQQKDSFSFISTCIQIINE